MSDRREFIKKIGIVSGAIGLMTYGCIGGNNKKRSKNMILRFKPYELQLKHVFAVAGNARRTTAVMFTEIEYDGIIGYGEASMPPYLGESHETATNFLQKVDLSGFSDPFQMEEILEYVDNIAPGNYAAKASVDIALHDLVGKIINQPWYRIWGLNPDKTPNTSFTIGIDEPDVVRLKTNEAAEYKIIKVKLGADNDKEMIETIRSVTNIPLCADVNQGWRDKNMALDMIHWLNERNVVFIEQPMPKEWRDEHAWLTERSPIPVIADESVQTLNDIKNVYGAYDGINIKLMKCGGMRTAFKMISAARALDMKVMFGCMVESSCAISAATQLSPLIDWADLDGNLLISNDVFDGVKVIDGKLVLNNRSGIGVLKIS